MGLKIISPNTIYLGSATGSGGGGGGSSSLPIIVKNSGNSLPSASSYSIGDKFLQTSAKKIYTPVVNGYITNGANCSVEGLTVDWNNGIGTGFSNSSYCYHRNLNWESSWNSAGATTKTYSVKFKISSLAIIPIFRLTTSQTSGPSSENAFFAISTEDNKIHHIRYSGGYSYNKSLDVAILDTILETNTIYILNIQKTGTDCVAQLTLEDGTVVEEKTFTTTNFGGNLGGCGVFYGGGYVTNSYQYAGQNLSVYLVDSYGSILIPNTSTLSWDNGTDLVNNTEYADKTNGILYIYENNELLAINTPTSFSQITGQPSDNSNLASALNGKQAVANSVTYGSASLSFSISANKHYVLSNSALTSITFSSCEKSFDETTIEFKTGATPPSVTDNSGITWMDNFDITNLSANKSYLIVIFNKLGFVKEY